MMVDVDRLRAELQFITDHRELWDQSVFIAKASTECGTACCLAGWTALHESNVEPDWSSYAPNWLPIQDGYDTAFVVRDGAKVSVRRVAMDALGLDEYDADRLFDGDNGLGDLWDLAFDITAGAIEIPAEFAGGAS